jgi:hypothetical protein
MRMALLPGGLDQWGSRWVLLVRARRWLGVECGAGSGDKAEA